MKKILWMVALSSALAGIASALPVTYSTTDTLNCGVVVGCTQVDAQTIQFGGLQLQVAGIPSSSVNATPFTFGSFGDIFSTCVGGGGNFNPTTLPAGLTPGIPN